MDPLKLLHIIERSLFSAFPFYHFLFLGSYMHTLNYVENVTEDQSLSFSFWIPKKQEFTMV